MAGKRNALRSLTRLELLELLGQQEREIEQLKAVIAQQSQQLQERKVIVETSGSLAEAALRLSGIFEAADRAADIYKASLGLPENPREEA